MDGCGTTQLPTQAGEALTQNVLPLLHEIRHALARLLDSAQPTTIDLRSIPMAPGEEDRLVAALGRGEVEATLSALGPSEIVETRYPGVWLVTHYNSEHEVVGKFIEVCTVPQILGAQEADVQHGLAQLTAQLA